jgi:hypothetical protein
MAADDIASTLYRPHEDLITKFHRADFLLSSVPILECHSRSGVSPTQENLVELLRAAVNDLNEVHVQSCTNFTEKSLVGYVRESLSVFAAWGTY